MNTLKALLLAVVPLTGVALVSVAPAPVAASGDAAPRTSQEIWEKMCKSCHGTDGRGNAEKAKVLKIDPLLLNLGRPGAEKITAEERKAILLDGKEKMPGYAKKLKADEVDPLLELCVELAESARKTP